MDLKDVAEKQARAFLRALDALRWYSRTRPDATRHVLAPGIVTLLTLLIAVVWGQPQLLLLAAMFVVAFVFVAGGLVGELRDVEVGMKTADAARREVAPRLSGLATRREPSPAVAGASPPQEEPNSMLSLLDSVTPSTEQRKRPRTGPRGSRPYQSSENV
jgi:hypothetical protein